MNKSDIMKAADRAAKTISNYENDEDFARTWEAEIALIAAAELLKQVEWQPIESAPKDGTRILLRTKHFGIDVGSWKEDQNVTGNYDWFNEWGDDFSTGFYYCPLSPTHFMPLPQPPVIIEKEGV